MGVSGATSAELESYKLVSRACINALFIPAMEVMQLFDSRTLANDLLKIRRAAAPLIGHL
jgi:hypothetical protein